MDGNETVEPQADIRTDEDDPALLHIAGEIDVATSPELRRALTRVAEEGHSRIVLDLSGLTFIDSSGLGVLVGGLKRVRERNGVIVLRSMQPAARRVIEITGLSDAFVIED